ncbi:MAG: MATE family efflux transporter [Oscillospiraceae bacterium]|nr:MATE family efflux transporter [Oscillospiraceae bacterium]
MQKDLTVGTPWKLLLGFSLPIMLGNTLQHLYNTADTIIVGNILGEAALSAVGICLSLTMLFTFVAMGFSVGAGVLIAQYFGARQEAEMRRSASTAILLLLGMGAAATVLGYFVSPYLLEYVIKCPPEFLSMAVEYFQIYALGLLFQFGYNIVSYVLRSVGDSRATLIFLLVSSVINVGLDLLLVPKMGVAGAAWATDIAQLISCVVAFIYMYRRYPVFRFGLKEWCFDTAYAWRTLRVGAPMAFQQVIVSCGFMLLQRIVNGFDYLPAAFTVQGRLENYLLVPVLAMQQSQATFAAQNMGACKPERVTQGLRHGIVVCLCMSAVLSTLAYIFAPDLAVLFGVEHTQSIAYCVEHLRIACFAVLIFDVYYPASGMMQGVGEGMWSMASALIALSVRVGFAAIFSTTAISYYAIFFAQPVSWILGGIFCYCGVFFRKWRTKSLIQKQA